MFTFVLALGIAALNLVEPSEIQQLAIPSLLRRESIQIRHYSKSGKSLALAISILQLACPSLQNYQAVILLATREQIQSLSAVMSELAQSMPAIKIHTLIAGTKMRDMIENVKEGGHQIMIASPGRFEWLMQSRDDLGLVVDLGSRFPHFVETLKTFPQYFDEDVEVVSANCIPHVQLEAVLHSFKHPPIKIVNGQGYVYCGDTIPIHVLREDARRDHLIKSNGYRFGSALKQNEEQDQEQST
ncbi:P-loop containing nucleoside triphosphate hydrolase protein [Lepidopterella palustris CBS 459.81]|uniref:RNA helicase n=1 Tax=Lepidopterella palustris CBS 459.81 TaxID=1314670 RepID=A0A8E2JB20_9PEZI|nr:P-loop containing nucleoside triphosphate hydrolase protein [Lepidopterella palustris CBS 459.81]